MKKRRLLYIFGLVTMISFLVIAIGPATGAEIISDITISNLNEIGSATVSWITDEPSTASVFYKVQGGTFKQANDTKNSRVHYVEIKNLTPDTQYLYYITSGSIVEDNEGTYYSFITFPYGAPTLPGNELRIGSIVSAGGSVTNDALLFLRAEQNGDMESCVVSARITKGAGWEYVLGNMLTVDGGPYLWQEGQDILIIEIDGVDEGKPFMEVAFESGLVNIPTITLSIPLNDSDGDGVADEIDNCLNVANQGQEDTDGDGVGDACDSCPNDPAKTEAGICGCGIADTDSDSDGTADCLDNCPNDPAKTEAGICGCGVADTDSDSDGTADCLDNCPNDPAKTEAGICGCGVADTDSDSDGTADCLDNCPNDPAKTEPGVCGCGVADVDTDQDGIMDCEEVDGCPDDPAKTEPGICGCGVADTDSDGDGTADCLDNCPNDPAKIEAGVCGCGVADTDSDSDGVADCLDNCPNDPAKTEAGVCGCGVADTDSDSDGTPDCLDECPSDAAKTEPGICGCGVADSDSDGDGIADCIDNCPTLPNPTQADADGDGMGDACDDDCFFELDVNVLQANQTAVTIGISDVSVTSEDPAACFSILTNNSKLAEDIRVTGATEYKWNFTVCSDVAGSVTIEWDADYLSECGYFQLFKGTNTGNTANIVVKDMRVTNSYPGTYANLQTFTIRYTKQKPAEPSTKPLFPEPYQWNWPTSWSRPSFSILPPQWGTWQTPQQSTNWMSGSAWTSFSNDWWSPAPTSSNVLDQLHWW
ncbi:MAG: thrombospondin type 3 repeat-containing protein [bacterium]